MPRNEAARKSGRFIAVCVTPDVCLTPLGNIIVPVPYQIVAHLGDSSSLSPNVHFGGDPAFIVNKSKVVKVTGDEAGIVGGVRSGTNRAAVEPTTGSDTVCVNGKPVVRHGDQCKMNNGNTFGKFLYQGESAGADVNSNPPLKPETPNEEAAAKAKKGLWAQYSMEEQDHAGVVATSDAGISAANVSIKGTARSDAGEKDERNYSQQFDFSEMHFAGNHNGMNFSNMPVRITKADGSYLTTLWTDNTGVTNRVFTDAAEQIVAWAGKGVWEVTEEYEAIEVEDGAKEDGRQYVPSLHVTGTNRERTALGRVKGIAEPVDLD